MKKQHTKLMLASVPALAMSMVVGTAYGGCASATVTGGIYGGMNITDCMCNGSINGVNRGAEIGKVTDSLLVGMPPSDVALDHAVYCQSPTATTCSGNLAKGTDRPSGKYTFESTYSGKPRFTCKWDKTNFKWTSGCAGATCNP